MAYERISDDEFTKEAKAMNAAAQGNSSGGNSKWLEEFKKIKYVPISTKCTVVRCLGRLPKHFGSTKSETDAMIVCRAPMMTDKGFTFDVTFPDPADNPNHILNKIAKKVMEFDWVKQADGSNKIVYIHQLSHPESFKWVRYGGVPEKIQKFNTGLTSKPVVIMNVIDRSDDYCAKNKKTKILCRGVSEYELKSGDHKGETVTKPLWGISLFTLNNGVQELSKNYGNWESYDMMIRKIESTGKNNKKVISYEFKNASNLQKKDNWDDYKSCPEIDDNFKKSISIGDLTDEEMSYERVDLEKFFGPTTATTLLKLFRKKIEKIDEDFDTDFISELEDLSAEEKKTWKAEQEARKNSKSEMDYAASEEASDDFEGIEEEPVAVTESKPETVAESSRRRIALTEETAPTEDVVAPKINKALLKWDDLDDNLRSQIEETIEEGGKLKSIEFKLQPGCSVEPCPVCNIAFPDNWNICPSCGNKFTIN